MGVVARKSRGMRLTDVEMFAHMIIMLDVTLIRIGDLFQPRVTPYPQDKILGMLVAVQSSPNMQKIPPMLPFNRFPRGNELAPVHKTIQRLVMYWDVMFARKSLGMFIDTPNVSSPFNIWYFRTKIWQRSRIPGIGSPGYGYDETKPSRLFDRVLQTRSLWNKVFGGQIHNGSFLSYSTMTTSGLTSRKLSLADSKMCREVDLPYVEKNLLSAYTQRACKLIGQVLGVEHLYRSQGWSWDAGKHLFSYRSSSSAGLRPGPTLTKSFNGEVYTATVNGSKGVQMEYTLEVLSAAIQKCNSCGVLKLPQTLTKVDMKMEVFNSYGLSGPDMQALADKVRYIWPCETMEFVVANAVLGYRQKVERGKHIKIGMVMAHGGAWKLAKDLHYDSPDHFWIWGDISGFDFSIMRFLLNIYSMQNLRYFDPSKFVSPQQWNTFLQLNRWCAHTLGWKVVRKINGEWVILEGSMGSGRVETSHGDSWIFEFLFLLWIVVLSDTVEGGQELLLDVLTHLAIKVVFGDDFVIAMLKKYKHFANFSAYKIFLSRFGLSFKEGGDVERFDTVLRPDMSISVPGVKFLQVFFVRQGQVLAFPDDTLPEILPFKDSDRLMLRSIYGNGEARSLMDYAVSMVGIVWASFGTNRLVYDYCSFMYVQILRDLRLSGTDWIRSYLLMAKKGVIDGILRKSRIDVDQLSKGFPTLPHLLSMNVFEEGFHFPSHSENEFLI